MIYKEEGGGSPQIRVDIQRRLIVHVTMHVIVPTAIFPRAKMWHNLVYIHTLNGFISTCLPAT
jgi:hypothetical protein